MQPNNKKKNPLFNYARYSFLAFQMVFIILAGVWFGHKLDVWLNLGFPVFTLIFSVISVVAAIYHSIKDFINPGKNE
ncbi:MAG: AtpZ/AtpI family protein [Bacteroidales bacterium]